MCLCIFLLWLVSIPLCHIHALAAPAPAPAPALAPKGFYLNCGSSKEANVGSFRWITDEGFVSGGNKTTLDQPDLMPVLTTLRFFPNESEKKHCYVIPVTKGAKYLVRTTYYYGGFDGKKEPPVFDQIIEGMEWSVVNTTEDFKQGLSSYYEIIVAATGKTLNVCLARNEHTVSSPFISALELRKLEDSMYNSTDFNNYALSTVARNSFGYDGDIISFPDDQYNRIWHPFTRYEEPVVFCHSNVSTTKFWNVPPVKVFLNAITTSRGKTLKVQWPANVSLPRTNYYIALYFQDNRTPSPFSWRIFDVSINGKNFYKKLNVTAGGVTVAAPNWPLSGITEITLTPGPDMPVGPIISAGEIFQLMPLPGKTVTRDVRSMEKFAKNINNPPNDWHGDPCLPRENSWTGVTCSKGKRARVITLNLTDAGLSGSLPPCLANLTGLTHIWLGGNKFTGDIPDLSPLHKLVSLRLDNNKLDGQIPQSLGELDNLQELFLQNNHLEGQVPNALKKKTGIKIKLSPKDQLADSA